jgi:hypothetical protein
MYMVLYIWNSKLALFLDTFVSRAALYGEARDSSQWLNHMHVE